MNCRSYKSFIFLVLFFSYCNALSLRAVNVLNKSIDVNSIKQIQDFVLEAKGSGLLDEESAKILMAYSLLTDVSMQDAQNFVKAVELSGVLNETRSVDITGQLVALNPQDAASGWSWILGGTSLALAACVAVLLFYDTSRNGRANHAKHKIHDALAWMSLTGENCYLKTEKALKNAFANN